MEKLTEYSPEFIRRTADEGIAILREITKSTEKLMQITGKLVEEYPVQDSERLMKELGNGANAALSGYSMQIRHLYMAADLYENSAGIVLSEAEQIVKGAGLQI